MDQNTCFAYLNMELPDDIRRLKEAGYYDAAIARIDACLAEDWTASQNQPLHPQGGLQLVQQLVGGESVVPRQTAQNFPVCQ